MLEANIKAPDFTLQDQSGKSVSLKDFAGKKVVVYFYPKDSTPGCTRQACSFTESKAALAEKNIVVIGISKDSVESHVKFVEKYNLDLILLSDPELEVIMAYDVWQEKNMYGKKSMGVVRTSYLIDENGMIVQVLKRVSPDKNVEKVLDFVNKL